MAKGLSWPTPCAGRLCRITASLARSRASIAASKTGVKRLTRVTTRYISAFTRVFDALWDGSNGTSPPKALSAARGGCARAAGHVAPRLDAETYPSRPVRIIVGLAAGGGTDIVARLIAQWLSERLGLSFVIENRPGAAGNVATEAVVNAPADGYTLLAVIPAPPSTRRSTTSSASTSCATWRRWRGCCASPTSWR